MCWALFDSLPPRSCAAASARAEILELFFGRSIVGWGAQLKKNWPGHSLARGNTTTLASLALGHSILATSFSSSSALGHPPAHIFNGLRGIRFPPRYLNTLSRIQCCHHARRKHRRYYLLRPDYRRNISCAPCTSPVHSSSSFHTRRCTGSSSS